MIHHKTNKSHIKKLLSVISILVTTFYPILFLYFKNIIEARERHLIIISLVFLLCSSFIYIITFLLTRTTQKAILLTNIIATFLFNYEFIATLFVKNSVMYIITALIMSFIVYKVYILQKRISADTINLLNIIWCITLASLLLLDSLPAMPYMLLRITARIPVKYESTVSEAPIETPNSSDTTSAIPVNRPNVYLLIFDEYGGPENLQHYFDYDNSDFYSWLQERKFNISYSSRNVESISTVTNVPNLLNLDYVVDYATEGETYTTYIKNPYIYSLFANWGYNINTVSYVDFLDNAQSTLHYDTKQLYEDTVGYYILQNSAFIHIYTKLISPHMSSKEFASSDHSGLYLTEAFDFYKNLALLENNQSNFNLAYFTCPHTPLCYKSDGTEFTEKELASGNPNNYLEYLKWTTTQIYDITQHILDNDPHSIIIIMSDHGYRGIDLESDSTLNDIYFYKKNILNCVYIDGEQIDIEGMTGINTLITVINNEFNTDFESKTFFSH